MIAILIGLVAGALVWGAMALSGWQIVRDFLQKYQQKTREGTFEGSGREDENGERN